MTTEILKSALAIRKEMNFLKSDLQQVEEGYIMTGQEGHIQYFRVVVDEKTKDGRNSQKL